MVCYHILSREAQHASLCLVLPTRIGADARLFNDTESLMEEYMTTGFIKGAGMQREWCSGELWEKFAGVLRDAEARRAEAGEEREAFFEWGGDMTEIVHYNFLRRFVGISEF